MARVLYIDPDPNRAARIVELLVRRGHHVTSTRSAERAMMHVDRCGSFEVVVSHLWLPSIDGAEFCRWLQRRSGAAGVPRVVFTAPDVELRFDLRGELPHWLPADLYVHAVEDLEKLVEAVEKVLGAAS